MLPFILGMQTAVTQMLSGAALTFVAVVAALLVARYLLGRIF